MGGPLEEQKGSGHRGRLRDRFIERGLDGFTDAEVLELLLTLGTPRTDCKKAARAALAKFETLSGVLEASDESLQAIHGIGPKNGFALHFVQAVAARYLADRIKGRRYLHSSSDVRDFLLHTMRGLKKEVFTVIFLDSSHGIIDSEILAEGTINVNTIYPRELVKAVLAHNAAALVIAHNHPSGSLEPSEQDMELTRRLHLVCSFIQVKLLDHIIIGNGAYSFADHGVMTAVNDQCRELVSNCDPR
ncbi:MAG: DNA repair protein RadC [Thermodesulfobacteriota bacterium]